MIKYSMNGIFFLCLERHLMHQIRQSYAICRFNQISLQHNDAMHVSITKECTWTCTSHNMQSCIGGGGGGGGCRSLIYLLTIACIMDYVQEK